MPATFIVPDVVDDVVAAEIFKSLCGRHHVLQRKVVTHYLDAEILARLDDNLIVSACARSITTT